MADERYRPDIDEGEFAEHVPSQHENAPADFALRDGDHGSGLSDDIEIDNDASQVASAPAKNIALIAILAIGAIVFLYNMVFKEDEATRKENETKELIESQSRDNAQAPVREEAPAQIDIGVVETPDLPDLSDLAPPPPLPPPAAIDSSPELSFPDPFGGFEPEPLPEPASPVPASPSFAELPNVPSVPVQPAPVMESPPVYVVAPEEKVEVSVDELEDLTVTGPTVEQLRMLRQSVRRGNMLLKSGSGISPTDSDDAGVLEATSAEQVTATLVTKNTDILIAQGKIIDAILETAISTDVEGDLRAIISRDVYAETGRKVLIPKGSRLIGNYGEFSAERGKNRIGVSWTRIIRPDGVDIAINAPVTDPLGRAGLEAIVDNKYFEIFSNAILVSMFTIGGSIALEKLQDSSNVASSTTSTNTDGSTSSTQSGAPSDFAVMESVSDLTSTAEEVGRELLDSEPTFHVQQGTRIKIFVNKDIIFPSDSIQVIK